MEAARKLNRLYASAIIAGGYPRDITLGAKPKDIDVFIDSQYFPTQDRRDAAADNIFAAFGQTWTRDAEAAGLPANAYGEAPAGQLVDGFQVYYSITNEGEWENVNLIFSRHNERVSQFDWSICRAFLYTDGIEFGRHDQSLTNIQLMATQDVPKIIEHAKRIKEKYPAAVFKIPTRFVGIPNLYRQLVEGGIIDGPREVVQAQAQGVVRDAMGFDTRVVNPQQIDLAIAQLEERQRAWAEFQRGVQQNIARPRTATFNWDEGTAVRGAARDTTAVAGTGAGAVTTATAAANNRAGRRARELLNNVLGGIPHQ